MAIRVYLADLRHTYSGIVANDCMPLGIAYMKAVMDYYATNSINSRLFVYPDRLLSAINDAPPDVLMLTNYSWNEALMKFFVAKVKRVNPSALTVAGGPNIPLEPDRQQSYIEGINGLDTYVLGEGDFRALDIVEAFSDRSLSITQFAKSAIPSCLIKQPGGEVILHPLEARHKKLDEIPSPWLTGIQDEFFDGRLAPMIETNRGCPFTCTFCVQGTSFYTGINHFPMNRLKEEIEYIARRMKQECPSLGTLRIADSNYGMYERDSEISEFIGQMQRDYGWPTFIDATTGKNRPDRIIRSVEKVSGALVLYQAVQSLNEDVLRNIKRSTIKLSAYKELGIYMRGRGLRSVSDLILGLPGESLATHLDALKRLIDSDIDQLHNMQAMLLKGSEMETADARRSFRFETRFRLVPRNFGSYEGTRVFDIEEIVIATDTMSLADYIEARKWHLISSVFWNDGWFDACVKLSRAFGIHNSEWWESMLPAVETGPLDIRQFMESFVKETTGQLFGSREECQEYYSKDENFARLKTGEIGDNLMYRYRAIASFSIWEQICAVALSATRRLLEQRNVPALIPNFSLFFEEFQTFVYLSHATGRDRDSLLQNTTARLHFDFPSWLASNSLSDPNAYAFSDCKTVIFRLRKEDSKELDAALKVWTSSSYGLSKLVTRIKPEWQTRECVLA